MMASSSNSYDDDVSFLPTTLVSIRRHLKTIEGPIADESFDDYVPTTTDPGSILFIIAMFICGVSLVMLPICAPLLNVFLRRKKSSTLDAAGSYSKEGDNNEGSGDTQLGDLEVARYTSTNPTITNTNYNLNETTTTTTTDSLWAEVLREEEEETLLQFNTTNGILDTLTIAEQRRRSSSTTAWCCCNSTLSFLRPILRFCWKLAKFDTEMKRILGLAIPFTLSAFAYNAGNLVILAIISHYMGTDEVVAYCMVYLMVGVTSSFMGSWVDAISSLGSMAYGAKNYVLLTHYLKVSCLAYTICEIPCAILWYCYIGKLLRIMGFDENIATLGQDYVWVAMSTNIVSYWNTGLMEFLEVIGHATYCSAMYITFCFVEAALIVPFALLTDRVSLVEFGLVMLFASSLLFTVNILIPTRMGWLRDYEDGLHMGLSIGKILSVAKSIFKVAVPLAFGNLLSYSEWEILTILAAMLGPAEAATWAILGYVWGFFESTTNAIGSASELRVAYHLGNGQPDMAKLSAYKSMLLAAIVTGLSSVLLMSLVDQLPPLMTYDTTIQGMLVQLFPLVALGNVTMSMGMVCWAIVGAQGRYRLSTTIATSCAFFITIPIGATLTIWMRIDLQGLTFAVVVGYTITAMILSLVVLTSDWKALSTTIKQIVDDLDESSPTIDLITKERHDTPAMSTPGTTPSYTPPRHGDGTPPRYEDFTGDLEIPHYQLMPNNVPPSSSDGFGGVYSSAPLPSPVTAVAPHLVPQAPVEYPAMTTSAQMPPSYQQETYPSMIDILSNITPPTSEKKMLSSTSTEIVVQSQQKLEEEKDTVLSIPLPPIITGLAGTHPTDELVAHKVIIPSNSSSELIENEVFTSTTPAVENSSQLPPAQDSLLTDKSLDASQTPDLVVNQLIPDFLPRIKGLPEMGHHEVNVMADAHKASIDSDDTFTVDMISSSLLNKEPSSTAEAPETLATTASVVDTAASPDDHALVKGSMPSESSDVDFIGDVVSIDDSTRASHESTVDTTLSYCKSIDDFVAAQLSASLMHEKEDKDQDTSTVDDSIDMHSMQLRDKTFGFDDYMMKPSPTIYHDALDATITFESTSELSDKLNDGADAVSPLEPDQMVESRIGAVESSDSSIYEDAVE